MRLLNIAALAGADVAMPQAAAFAEFSCQFRALWAIVHVGRTQAAFTSHKGAAQSTLPAIKWSRGCRALRLQYWHFAWLPSWQLAPRKKKKSFTWTSRPLRPSLSTPANTSKTKGRALWAALARPALFLSADLTAPDRDTGPAAGHRFSSAAPTLTSLCLSALARFAPVLLRLANPSDLTGRAGSLWPATPDRPSHAKVQSC